MYDVTASYQEAIKQPIQEHHIRGVIAASAGGTWNFTDANILEGTFNLTNQCTDTSDIVLGSCFLGQLSATFTGLEIFRTNWIDLTITVYFQLYFNQQDYEEVPLGIYTIKEATHTANGVEVVAYDNMYKFDKKFKADGFDRIGIAWEYLTLICQRCGVTIGMSQTEVDDLPNGLANLYLCGVRQGTVDYANDIETYRDVLFWLCQVTASFATIDRWGQLVMKPFKTAQSVDTISDEYRLSGAKFADYVTSYNGIYTESLYDGDVNYYGYDLDALLEMKAENDDRITEIGEEMTELEREHDEHEITDEEYRTRKAALTKDLKRYQKYDKWLEKMIAKASEGDSAYMELGANPFFQRRDSKIPSIAQATLATTLREKIMKAVQKIEYTPFSCDTIFGVHYDLGDVLTFTGGHADDDICCIMSYDWTLHGTYTMEGYGINPDEQAVKDVDKKQSNRAQKNALKASRNDATEGGVAKDGDMHTSATLTDDILQESKEWVNSTTQHPISIFDFVRTDRKTFSFKIRGNPSANGPGETCGFTLAGLVDGQTYKLSFDLQYTEGLYWPWTSYDDYLVVSGNPHIAFVYNGNVNHYEYTFTYSAGNQHDFQFYFARINDNAWFTAVITNMTFEGSFDASGISVVVNGEWQTINFVRKINDTKNSGLKIGVADNSDNTKTDIYVPNMSGASASAAGSNGLVPAPASGDEGKFLRGDGTWQNAGGGGGSDLELEIDNGEIVATYGAQTEETEPILKDSTGDDIVTMLEAIATEMGALASPEIYAPVVYSTEEREIGVWTDGKPLYQKTIFIHNNSTVTTQSYSFNNDIPNCELVVTQESCIKLAGTSWVTSDAYTNTTQYRWDISVNSDAKNIGIQCLGWGFTDAYVTLRYTKTTDIAGSGNYAALGVPAVHYSTNEHVVGTWIDGKPLYQKSFIGTSAANFSTSAILADTGENTVIRKFDGLIDGRRALNSYSGADDTYTWVTSDLHRIANYAKGASASKQAIVTVEYTKTTD